MAKQFIVRLKSGGKILANSQIITIKGLGDGPISPKDFTDGSLKGTVVTENGVASLSKTVAASDWVINTPACIVDGGSSLTINWTAKNNTATAISYYIVFPGTLNIYSGASVENSGGLNALQITGTSGSFVIQTKVVSKEEQFEVVMVNGSLDNGIPLSRSCTIRVVSIDFSAKLQKTTIYEGEEAFIEIKGAPFEYVAFRGETNGNVQLDKSGTYIGSLNPGIIISPGNYVYIVDGNLTDTVVTLNLTVKTLNRLLARAESTLVANNMPITVRVTGTPSDAVTAIRTGSSKPYRFTLSPTGSALINDIRDGQFTPGGSTYTWNFDGDQSEGNPSISVEVRDFTLAVNPTSGTAARGRSLNTIVTGVPGEIVTVTRYPGSVDTVILDDSGAASVDLTFGKLINPGTYTWTLDGNKTPNNVEFTGNITQQNFLRVSYAGPSTIRQGIPIIATIFGSEFERVSFAGNTTGTTDLNSAGLGTQDLTLSTSLSVGTKSWVFTGNKSAGSANLTVAVAPASNLYVTGNVIFREQDPIPLTVYGANLEIITVTTNNKLPINFALDATGTKVTDLSPMGFVAAINPYTVYFTGTYDSTVIVPYSFSITPRFVLTVTGPQPSVIEGDPINVTITGAPGETVTSTFNGGIPGPVVTLNTYGVGTLAYGQNTLNLTSGVTLAAQTTPYTWIFGGTISLGNPTYSVRIDNPYPLLVTAATYSPPSGSALNVTITGAPGEVVTYTGSVNNGSRTLSSPVSGPGSDTFNILSGVSPLTPGPYSWTFTGGVARTNNTKTLSITVGIAIPSITSFSRSGAATYYWTTTGTNIVRHYVRVSIGSSFNAAAASTVTDLYSNVNNVGPINLEAGLSSGNTYTFRLLVYNNAGGVSVHNDLTVTL